MRLQIIAMLCGAALLPLAARAQQPPTALFCSSIGVKVGPMTPAVADSLGMTQRYDASAKAAQEIGVTVQPLGVRQPDDFNEAFDAMNRDPPDAILMVTDVLTLLNRKRVFDYAA